MNPRIIRCTQQSDLWIAARRGRITGSRLGDVMAPPISRQSTRKGRVCPAGTEAQCREDYRRELVVERITHRAVNHPPTRAMMEGTEREPFARMIYEAETQKVVELVGFALHPEWDWFGSSADGLVALDGGVELKSPTEMVHDSYIQDVNLMVEEYRWQVLGNLACFPTREWWDLASFNPYFPDELKLLVFRLHRSDYAETLRQIQDAAWIFNTEIEAEIVRRGQPPTVWDILPQGEPEPSAEQAPDTPYQPDKPFADQDFSFLDGTMAELIDAP